eukprot:379236-Prorocentrum_lima.AAC.1
MTSSLVGSEMCIRDSFNGTFTGGQLWKEQEQGSIAPPFEAKGMDPCVKGCLLYTSDAADDM